MARRKNSYVTLQQGSSVYYNNEHFVVVQLISLEHILAENVQTHEIKRLKISEITTTSSDSETHKTSVIDAILDEDWRVAQERMAIIQPLVHKPGRTKADVEAVAKKHQLHINTIYKWLQLYEPNSLLTSLTPKTRKDAGTKKLADEVEAIISACIEEEYLSKQRKSVSTLYNVVALQCRQANLTAPHPNTVRNRVKVLSEQLRVARRFGSKKAENQFSATEGAFPHADYPLAVIQIDHTPIDLILVDDEYRLPIGRPWITLAIDVYSRMVVGVYVSFDPPSATSTGICLSHAILPKDNWLVLHDIAASWPCWGLPRTVHADNAKEFRGNMLQKACEEYNINLEWRPVARPHYGGHIERLLGTFAKEIHALPGTTFSNTKQREGYDSEKESALTLSEFERWLAILITESYHQKVHSGIGCSPLKKYEEGILGTKNTKGVGLPRRIEDEQTLLLNFLPYEERTVQDYGIRILDIYYFHDVLRIWINSTVEGRSKLKRMFICRVDPRDISIIWFFDPQLKTYFPIPYRNTAHPAMSLWELKAVRKQLKSEGHTEIDEDMIFSALEKMRRIEQDAVEKTKKSRRALQRRKSSQEKASAFLPSMKNVSAAQSSSVELARTQKPSLPDDDDIKPFEEMLEVRRHD